MGARYLHFLWLFGGQNSLAVATVFVDLWAPFYSQGGGGGLIRETKVPMQELELKMEGGLCARGGVIAGFYGT